MSRTIQQKYPEISDIYSNQVFSDLQHRVSGGSDQKRGTWIHFWKLIEYPHSRKCNVCGIKLIGRAYSARLQENKVPLCQRHLLAQRRRRQN